MAGYHNYSMSNNAVAAYARGEMPLSKWTKAAILAAAAEYLEHDENGAQKLEWLRAGRLANLKRFALHNSSWHHTSSHYNSTDFFSLDELNLDNMTEIDAAKLKENEEAPAVDVAPGRRVGCIEWLEWGGTRKHPRAFERKLENVEIEEKGCFYLVFKNGVQVLKKKIGSNGTVVNYK